jgi:methionyl-tRNA formyltransferase
MIMKIACLIRDKPVQRFFVQTIHRTYPVALIVIESNLRARARRELRSRGLAETAHLGLKLLRSRIFARAEGRDYRAVFNEAWRALPDAPTLRTEDVNANDVAAALRRLDPDVILCHGTSLIRRNILDTVPLALNLHWGLSPWYRGCKCTEWALLAGDVHNVGVTIHRLTRSIDGGEILGQVRVAPEPGDSLNRINCRLTAAGVIVLVDALARLGCGEPLQFRKQDLAQGLLYYERQWTRLLDRQIARNMRKGSIAKMLRHPARQPLPLVAPWPPVSLRVDERMPPEGRVAMH